MSIRSFLEEHSKIATPVAIVLVIGLLAFIFYSLGKGPQRSAEKWMFDLNTGRLQAAPRHTTSPSDLGNGNFMYPGLGEAGSAVDAVVYTCGDADTIRSGMNIEELAEVDAYIGYLSRWPKEALRTLEAGDEVNLAPEQQLISDPSGQRWVSSTSRQGEIILRAISDLCGGDDKQRKIARP